MRSSLIIESEEIDDILDVKHYKAGLELLSKQLQIRCRNSEAKLLDDP